MREIGTTLSLAIAEIKAWDFQGKYESEKRHSDKMRVHYFMSQHTACRAEVVMIGSKSCKAMHNAFHLADDFIAVTPDSRTFHASVPDFSNEILGEKNKFNDCLCDKESRIDQPRRNCARCFYATSRD
jgi:hypothetical protein